MNSALRFLPDILLKRRPIHLTVFVTRRCNAKCPFCFYANNDKPDNTPELSLGEMQRLSASTGPLLWLAFSGGEVFLRDDLVEISRAFYRHNRPTVMLYSTNALMPGLIRERTEAILRACPDSVVVLKLSLDGVGAGHDALRGVPGSFEKVMETYEALGGLLQGHGNFELGINTVFCADNQDRMDEIIDFVRTLRMVKTHTISMVRGDVGDGHLKDVDLDRYLAAIERLEHNLKKEHAPTYGFRGAKIKAAQDILQRRIIYRTLREKKCQLPCYAGRLNLVVTDTADVYPCELFTEALKLGNLREQCFDLPGLLKRERAKEVLSSIKDGCFCSHECYTMTNILFNPRMYPALLREYLQVG